MSLSTYFKQDSQPKVHYSEYLKTENKPDKEEKAADTPQPEPKETE